VAVDVQVPCLLPGAWYVAAVTDVADVAPGRYAPVIAPVIERLTLSVVNKARARAATTPAPSAAAPDAMRMLGQLRTALLARTVTAVGLAAVYRYRDAADVRRDLDGLLAAGLVEGTGDGAVQATERGHAVLNQMYGVTAEVARELWSEHDGRLVGLSDLAGQVVQAALASGGDAYATMAPPYEPADATAGLVLHTRLSVLRYHRADAHAAAWQAAGLTAATVRQLPAGPIRDAIEAETNRRAGLPYAALSPDERLTFLAGLAVLPG
jgi:hypothetical protein